MRHLSAATRPPGAAMRSVRDENRNCAAEQQRGRLRPPCMKTLSDDNSSGDEDGVVKSANDEK